jgi:hypothetical protein
MPKKTHQLRDLHITKIALVRKGYRPVNDGARITIVKAQKEDVMSDTKAAEASVLERMSKAFAKMLGDPEPDPADTGAAGEGKEDDGAATGTETVDVEKAVADAVEAKLKPLSDQVAAFVAKSEEISKAQPTEEHLAELVKAQVEPLAKAIEDFAVKFNRQPVTPNVTQDIPPGTTTGTVTYADIKDKEYGEALRTLLHSPS